MLEYAKMILKKVSFDEYLFRKELRKCITYLTQESEVSSLRHWAYQQFRNSSQHLHILDEFFYAVPY